MLYNKDTLYIDTRYGIVFKYLFICPVTYEIIVEVIAGKGYDCFDRDRIEHNYYYECNVYSCKHYRECRLITSVIKYDICALDQQLFNRLLSDKKIIHYNKLNSVLYLKDNVRKYIERWLQK